MTVIQNPQPTQKPNFLPPTHPRLLRGCFHAFPFLGSPVIAFKCSSHQSHRSLWRQSQFLQNLEKSRQEASLSTFGIHIARTILSILEENPGRRIQGESMDKLPSHGVPVYMYVFPHLQVGQEAKKMNFHTVANFSGI